MRTRKLHVQYVPGRIDCLPLIRFGGHWLLNAGFRYQDQILVTPEPGVLTILNVNLTPEAKNESEYN